MMSKLFHYCSLFLILLTLVSCHTAVYEKFHEVPDKQWNKNYPMEYFVDIEKPRKYTFKASFSYLAFIAREEIKFKLKITSPSQKEIFLDSYSVLIRNTDGEQLGDVMGDYGDIDKVMETDFELSEAGKYKFELLQNDEPQSVGGITRVGLIVKKGKKN